MTLFKYKAKNSEGAFYNRTVEAQDRAVLYRLIREEGGSVVSVHEVKKSWLRDVFRSPFGGIKTQEKITLAKNLGSMIKAGLSVTRALAVMEKQATSKKLKKILAGISLDISHGETLSDSMKKRPKVFSPLFVSMVHAGEESGTVAESLSVVASQMEKSYELTRKVRSALIYPAIIISLMLVLGVLLLIFMVPTLTETFAGLGVELPLSTRVVIGVSNFFVSYLLLVIVMAIFFGICLMIFLKTPLGRNMLASLVMHIPVVGGISRSVQVARTARTLSSLLSAGVDIVVALDVTIGVIQNHKYKKTLQHVYASIQKGELMSSILESYPKLYPPFVPEMVAVGEETGKISEMLIGIAEFYEKEVEEKTKNLSVIIEPVLMIIIGMGVGLFAISMLAPTYSLVDKI